MLPEKKEDLTVNFINPFAFFLNNTFPNIHIIHRVAVEETIKEINPDFDTANKDEDGKYQENMPCTIPGYSYASVDSCYTTAVVETKKFLIEKFSAYLKAIYPSYFKKNGFLEIDQFKTLVLFNPKEKVVTVIFDDYYFKMSIVTKQYGTLEIPVGILNITYGNLEKIISTILLCTKGIKYPNISILIRGSYADKNKKFSSDGQKQHFASWIGAKLYGNPTTISTPTTASYANTATAPSIPNLLSINKNAASAATPANAAAPVVTAPMTKIAVTTPAAATSTITAIASTTNTTVEDKLPKEYTDLFRQDFVIQEIITATGGDLKNQQCNNTFFKNHGVNNKNNINIGALLEAGTSLVRRVGKVVAFNRYWDILTNEQRRQVIDHILLGKKEAKLPVMISDSEYGERVFITEINPADSATTEQLSEVLNRKKNEPHSWLSGFEFKKINAKLALVMHITHEADVDNNENGFTPGIEELKRQSFFLKNTFLEKNFKVAYDKQIAFSFPNKKAALDFVKSYDLPAAFENHLNVEVVNNKFFVKIPNYTYTKSEIERAKDVALQYSGEEKLEQNENNQKSKEISEQMEGKIEERIKNVDKDINLKQFLSEATKNDRTAFAQNNPIGYLLWVEIKSDRKSSTREEYETWLNTIDPFKRYFYVNATTIQCFIRWCKDQKKERNEKTLEEFSNYFLLKTPEERNAYYLQNDCNKETLGINTLDYFIKILSPEKRKDLVLNFLNKDEIAITSPLLQLPSNNLELTATTTQPQQTITSVISTSTHPAAPTPTPTPTPTSTSSSVPPSFTPSSSVPAPSTIFGTQFSMFPPLQKRQVNADGAQENYINALVNTPAEKLGDEFYTFICTEYDYCPSFLTSYNCKNLDEFKNKWDSPSFSQQKIDIASKYSDFIKNVATVVGAAAAAVKEHGNSCNPQ